ncbi:SLC13 family permease [Peptoniphilaceae bacterium SGI.131]
MITMAYEIPGLPMHLVATIGAILIVATGCLTEKEAFNSIDISTVLIVGGMSAVSKAMDLSGGGKLIANTVIGLLGNTPSKFALLAVIFILTVILTNIMMNTTTALLVTPIFLPIAINYGMNTEAVAIAICIAASSPFLSPVGSGTNTLVVKPENLKFMDFFKPGISLTIVITVVSLIFIPIFFPL